MSDAQETTHAPGDAQAADGGGHGHEPDGEPLGPLDVETWVYALGGGLIGLLVVAALFAARGG